MLLNVLYWLFAFVAGIGLLNLVGFFLSFWRYFKALPGTYVEDIWLENCHRTLVRFFTLTIVGIIGMVAVSGVRT